jgi:hypothetical protein
MIHSQARIGDLWCRLMHTEPMWPAHGQYECRTCGRRFQVCWQQPSTVAPGLAELSRAPQVQVPLTAGCSSPINFTNR